MGNTPSLTKEQKQEIVQSFSTRCKDAAQAILEADILLLATGAGFSADSGLAVYKDIADVPAYHKRNLTYRDICQPHWLDTEPNIFYGFWGMCFNDYRKTVPHDGYHIVKRWKNDIFFKKEGEELLRRKWQEMYPEKKEIPGPFFIYTSNVDNHSVTAGFDTKEVYHIHGTTEVWQCSHRCTNQTWNVPNDFIFEINYDTMEAVVSKKKGEFGERNGFVSNHPLCKNCGALARPAILMFGDGDFISNREEMQQCSRWQTVTEKLVKENNMKMVIVEIGCGLNVPSVRYHTEGKLKLLGENCTLIRINPDFPQCGERGKVISIMSKGLEALLEIEKNIQEIKNIPKHEIHQEKPKENLKEENVQLETELNTKTEELEITQGQLLREMGRAKALEEELAAMKLSQSKENKE
eukprot:TRINITY_DN7536_c0_g1_i1.p1 TRINITY_DN7536_c0_g1~~TRINITY_DN7536_c0_g1_i1.p1  ORF type:complete len:430 (+),score=106.53 TRINITY_DN7536_c0_g1_i1:64-1290(+)